MICIIYMYCDANWMHVVHLSPAPCAHGTQLHGLIVSPAILFNTVGFPWRSSNV